jgi:hypothetical protein
MRRRHGCDGTGDRGHVAACPDAPPTPVAASFGTGLLLIGIALVLLSRTFPTPEEVR